MNETIVAPEQQSLNYPLLADRVQSTFIDTILIVACMFPISALLENMTHPPDWLRVAIFFGLFGVYEPLCTMLGCTLGNYIKGIRVRRANDHSKKIGFVQAFIRYILKLFLGWVSFVTIHSNPQRRAIHDFAAGSVMIFNR